MCLKSYKITDFTKSYLSKQKCDIFNLNLNYIFKCSNFLILTYQHHNISRSNQKVQQEILTFSSSQKPMQYMDALISELRKI